MIQAQRMAERDEIRGLLGRLDTGNPRGRENIALCNPIGGNQLQGGRLQVNSPARDSFTMTQRLGRDIDHSGPAVTPDVTQARHASATDRNHLASRLISGAKIVLFWFALHHLEEELAQLRVARPGTQRFHNVEFEVAAKTWPKLPVAR